MNFIAVQELTDFESLLSLIFPKKDVLTNEKDRLIRRASLLKAATLDSLCPTEVLIFAESVDGCQKIKSRVQATGDGQIIIERGFAVPINAIHKIEFMA